MTDVELGPDLVADVVDGHGVVGPLIVGAESGRGAPWLRAARWLGSTMLSLGVVLLAWWLFLKLFHVQRFIGKTPVDVWRYLVSAPAASAHRHAVLHESATTLRDAFLGLFSGTLAALVAAGLFTIWRPLERTVMPIAMVLRSVPLVAMTPLIVLVFGRDLQAITVIAGIVTFFPTLVNVTLALRSTPQESMDLLVSWKVVPPYNFTGHFVVFSLRAVQ